MDVDVVDMIITMEEEEGIMGITYQCTNVTLRNVSWERVKNFIGWKVIVD